MKFILAMLLAASSLDAGVISGVYTGTVDANTYDGADTDTYGYFSGVDGTSLVGLAYTLTISYNPADCSYSVTPTYDQLYPCSAGDISESLTIDGTTVSATDSGVNGSVGAEEYYGEGLYSYQDYGSEYILETSLYTSTQWTAGQILAETPSASTLYSGESEVEVILPDDGAEKIYLDAAGTPEPSTLALLGGSLAAVFIGSRKLRAA